VSRYLTKPSGWEALRMNLPVPDANAEDRDAAGGPGAADGADTAGDRAAVQKTRKKLDDIFGDVLPSVTRDELDDRAEEAGRDTERDQWYRDNRPPHHG
jgi:hypothetical protein